MRGSEKNDSHSSSKLFRFALLTLCVYPCLRQRQHGRRDWTTADLQPQTFGAGVMCSVIKQNGAGGGVLVAGLGNKNRSKQLSEFLARLTWKAVGGCDGRRGRHSDSEQYAHLPLTFLCVRRSAAAFPHDSHLLPPARSAERRRECDTFAIHF
ncbi:hypothetical protein F2P81_008209 [Scophthalmus maximus]|uniref:Uncharacterized protein n=1 Tax=Scophthalmus maximus TaxID=52904 RepID=A0A6A4T9X9_SCOMX|nr:hypothetical protein F2P81_008209 [Scophthalmus maximus]